MSSISTPSSGRALPRPLALASATALVVWLANLGAGCSQVIGASDYKVAPLSCETAASQLEPTKRDRIVRACALLLGCNPFLPTQRLSDCVTYDTPELYTYYSSSLAAKSCADIEATQGIGWARPGDCASASATPHCVGTRAVTCRDGAVNFGLSFDCNVRGGTCTTYTASDGSTQVGCQVAAGSCTGSTQACESNSAYTCLGGKKIGLDCGKLNSTCKVSGGESACYFNGPTCDAAGVTCDGDVLVNCSGGQASRFDCGATGLKCSADGDKSYCLAKPCTTDQADGCEESCEDETHAVLCLGGSPLKVDCTSLGFSKCKPFDPNPSGVNRPYVLCE